MDEIKLRSELVEAEGYRQYPYRDTMGIWTAGIGHNLAAHGCSHAEIDGWRQTGVPPGLIDQWFADDLHDAVECARAVFRGFDELPENVQRTLVNMAFDLRYELRDWHHLQDAVREADWGRAALSIIDSKFAQEAPNRAARLAVRIVGG